MHPVPEPCPQRADHAQVLQSASQRLMRLSKLKLRAIKMGDLVEFENLSKEMRESMGLEDFLLQKLKAHIESHGC